VQQLQVLVGRIYQAGYETGQRTAARDQEAAQVRAGLREDLAAERKKRAASEAGGSGE
jgi:hypothetical protein